MDHRFSIISLRAVHGIVTAYFLWCLLYLFYAAAFNKLTWILALAITSLGVEGIAIFWLNHGDCPLIHVQRYIGDDKPFFELFLPAPIAKKAIPWFAMITWIALGLVILRMVLDWA